VFVLAFFFLFFFMHLNGTLNSQRIAVNSDLPQGSFMQLEFEVPSRIRIERVSEEEKRNALGESIWRNLLRLAKGNEFPPLSSNKTNFKFKKGVETQIYPLFRFISFLRHAACFPW
jgi:hypothetical protein